MREGFLLLHRYAKSLNLPEIEGDVNVYVYHNADALRDSFARSGWLSLEEARQGWIDFPAMVPHPEYMFVNSAFITDASPRDMVLVRLGSHELGHVYQHKLGAKLGLGPNWLDEGWPEFLSLRSLINSGVAEYAEDGKNMAEYRIGETISLDGSLKEMESVEDWTPYHPLYHYGYTASELLAAQAGKEAMTRYWTLLGVATSWQEAFQTAFGMTVEEFYDLFEEQRSAGFPALKEP